MTYLDSIKEAYKRNKIDYNEIFARVNYIGSYQEDAYMDIVIPSLGREKYVVSTLKYLLKSISLTDKKINVIIEDFDNSNFVINYIKSLPSSVKVVYLDCSKIRENFSRSMAMNVPVYYFKSRSKYLMFHDCDLLVDSSFIKNTVSNLKNTKTWLQPYTEKRVSNLTNKDSQSIMNGDFLDLGKLEVSHPGSGAPGGSIVVPNQLFRSVGGYNPELFHSYAPEDSFFWTKMESMFSKFNYISNCHVGSANYSLNTTVYHLNHPQGFTPPEVIDYNRMLWQFTHDERQELIAYKNSLYEKL